MILNPETVVVDDHDVPPLSALLAIEEKLDPHPHPKKISLQCSLNTCNGQLLQLQETSRLPLLDDEPGENVTG